MQGKSKFILALTLLGVFVGVLGGLFFGGHVASDSSRTAWTGSESFQFWLAIIRFPGELFVRALKCLVLPLIVASMITGVVSLGNIREMGKMGARAMAYFLATTLLACVIGVTLVLTIQPGAGVDGASVRGVLESSAQSGPPAINVAVEQDKPTLDRILDAGRQLVPSNLVEAALEFNMLGIIAFSLLFGVVLTMIGAKGKPVLAFFDGLNEAIMKLVYLLMYLMPIGIACLIAANIAGSDNLLDKLRSLMMYVLTVVAGLGIHLVIVLPLIYLLIVRKNPFHFLMGMAQALLTALGTSSSAATLPVTMECCELNNGISKRTTSFVLPLGATINMDGTALYEAVTVIFLAQMLGYPLSMADISVITMLSVLASIGAAAIPSAGMVTMIMVLVAVGMDPMLGIIYILPIDWFLDRLRTTVNVAGDAIGAGIVDHLENKATTAAPV